MKKIGITGENGFLGTHLKNYINLKSNYEFISLGRDYEKNISKLTNGDILIHSASIHRNSKPENVYLINMQINKSLLDLLTRANLSLNIIFLSSIQESLDNPYGRSKRDGKKLFDDYCKKNGTKFISHKLPNIFGPGAKPNFTSFIATFCYNIHNNIECEYNKNVVKLCFVDDAIKVIAKLSWENVKFDYVKVSVYEVYFLLKEFKKNIKNIDKLKSYKNFNKNLLVTFLSYKNYKIK